jgi:flagellar M-ring protein FliF
MLIAAGHLWVRGRSPEEVRVKNIIAIWEGLSVPRRVILIAATLGVFAAVLAIGRAGTQPDLALLYADLDPATAGSVIAALEAEGVAYAVDGATIRVDAARRDSLRMTRAAQGLPAATGAGYEILDALTGFGTTAQMFDAAYWRAKEGELARTILANPAVRSARVHIAAGTDSPFAAAGQATASVTVMTAGGALSDDQARAIRHLVAAAVRGMTVEAVTVVDALTGRISGPEGDSTLTAAADDRAAQIRAAVERLLAARVGPGRAVVEVNLDLVTVREEITERVIDPESRVEISSETEERTATSSQNEGQVTVASNLPDGDAAPGPQEQSQSSEERERVNYEVSQTERAILRLPGDIRRMTVAVLVDGQEVTAEDGAVTWQPRPDAELETLRELVASAVGIDEARGDVLTLRSLQFQPVAIAGTLADAAAAPWLTGADLMRLAQIALVALVAIVLGLFVVRPILAPRRLPAPPPLALGPIGAAGGAMTGGATIDMPRMSDGLTGEITDAMPAARVIDAEAETLSQDPVDRLRRLIAERQTESVEVLRSWLEREDQKA